MAKILNIDAPMRECFLYRNVLIYLFYSLMSIIALYPIFIVSVPNLEDYPNHLARMYIISHYHSSPDLQHFYEVKWMMFPYIGMDATFILLTKILPIYDAGRVFIGLCVIMPALSVAVLYYSVHRRLSLVPTVAFLFSYNWLLLLGFLDYLLFLCLAIIVFAGWISTTKWRRWPRLLVFCGLTLILYLGHLAAFGAYCLMVLCFEVLRAGKAGLRAWRSTMADWFFGALQAVPAVGVALGTAIELASRPKIEGSFVGRLPTEYGTVSEKFIAIFSPVLFSFSSIDAMCGVGIIILIFALLTGRLRLNTDIFIIFLIVEGMVLIAPVKVMGIDGIDARLALLGAMLLLSAISTAVRLEKAAKNTILGLLILLAAIRAAEISNHLQNADKQISELRQVIDAMPKGMRMLTVETSQDGRGPSSDPVRLTQFAPLLAVIDRKLFSPNLFSSFLGTVRPKQEFRSFSTPRGAPFPDVDQLLDGYGKSNPSNADVPDGSGGRIYWLGWERSFDYVLVLHYGKRLTNLPEKLHLVAASNIADLYVIEKNQ